MNVLFVSMYVHYACSDRHQIPGIGLADGCDHHVGVRK